jgi:hypothetical protein
MDSPSKQLSQRNVRSSASVRLVAISTRSHRTVLRGRDEIGRRARDDAQYLGGRRLLVQCLGEFARTRFEFLLQLRSGFANAVNVSSRLRCLRTKTRSALRPFARQGHPVGTATAVTNKTLCFFCPPHSNRNSDIPANAACSQNLNI